MDILIASFNPHKIEEFSALLPGHRLLAPADVGIAGMNIDENGKDYFENAMIKARALFLRTGLPTLADDSGLSVDALDGRPGIHSSRYGATDQYSTLTSPERNALLLREMRGASERTCAFYCCLVLLYGKDRFLSVQETCPGILAMEPRGSGGFGYDPLVFLPEFSRTVAELSPEEKNSVSHRGKAAKLLLPMLSDQRRFH